jgi:hypothetical protein
LSCREVGSWSGLAVTYSPASWDAVPLAPVRLTAEFGMGSGVSHGLWPPDRIRTPSRPFSREGGSGCIRRLYPGRVFRLVRVLTSWPVGQFLPVTGSDQANRTISTGRLSALPRLHLRPIDVVVCHGPQGRPGFEGGFPLRCLQRLSRPFIATRHCRWHDNRSTSGTFTPVLSY